jgi:spermidine synthase
VNHAAEGAEASAAAVSPSRVAPGELALLVAVFVVAACGLVYELAAGALASYLLGDSVLQFSTVIGAYLFAMGLGSWLSRYIERQLVANFLRIELLVALFGGLMPAALFIAHGSLPAGETATFRVLLYGAVLLIGTLVGLEIPLVMRILKRHFSERYALKELVSQVLTFDYLGALVVAVAFPLLLVPHLGLIRTGLFFGLLNAAVAAWTLWLFRAELRSFGVQAVATVATLVILAAAMAGATHITRWGEDRFYGDDIIASEQTPWQRIVLTQGTAGTRLFLNGNLQFHSRDEHRYHEALVHPALAAHGAPRRVLVLGGGDGLAVREVLKHPSVQEVVLVELDPAMTRLFATLPRLRQLNADALASPKLKIINTDAFAWLESEGAKADRATFDVAIVDSTTFYRMLDQHLAAGGYGVIQTTSPLIARESFWTVVATLEAVGLTTWPYHAHVPSFGEWGFVLAGRRPLREAALASGLPAGLKFLDAAGLPALFHFPPDMARVPAEPNRLSDQRLVHVFEREWGRIER